MPDLWVGLIRAVFQIDGKVEDAIDKFKILQNGRLREEETARRAIDDTLSEPELWLGLSLLNMLLHTIGQ